MSILVFDVEAFRKRVIFDSFRYIAAEFQHAVHVTFPSVLTESTSIRRSCYVIVLKFDIAVEYGLI